jgi:NAD(P)-dependent dehydrogenase (short-subunit alcohol dehydrogenase family)
MKVVLIGFGGTIGKGVDQELAAYHDVVRVDLKTGDFNVDIADPKSIETLYSDIGAFDALVCTAGSVHFGPLEEFTPAHFEIGLRNKLMGQVNLVMLGLKHIRNGGSFTLTTGLLNEEPIREGVSAAMVNSAVEGFVRAAANVLPRGIRINVVSPAPAVESYAAHRHYFPGTKPVPASEIALSYTKSIEGSHTGRVYRAGWTRDL